MELYQWIILVAIVWHFLGFMTMLGMAEFWHLDPKDIYEWHRVNIFGCIVLTILFNLCMPVVSVGYWFYRLCTVGRE